MLFLFDALSGYCIVLAVKNYFRGVDRIAQNQWLKALEEHIELLLDSPYMSDRYRLLEEIASHIEGISTAGSGMDVPAVAL